MLRRFGVVMFAAASLGLAAVPVHAQLSKDILKCEDGTNKALGKFVGSKAKCASKCLTTARKTMGPYTGCFAPYSDPTTNTCITGSLKGAEAKGGAAIAKGCAALASCPTCYPTTPSSACTDASGANPFIQSSETNVDTLGPLVFCTENGGNTPSKDDAKCEDGISKALVKFVGAKGKCYQKCNDNMNKGKAAPGSCAPPASDPATVTCISDPLKGAEAKAAASITKACPAFPACSPITTGAGWVGAVEGPVDTTTSAVYCATPAPTFAHLVTTNLPGTAQCGGGALMTPVPSAPFGGAIFSDTACTTKISDLGLACLDLGGGNNTSTPPGPVVDGASTVFDISGSNLVASSGTGPGDCTKGAGPGKTCIGPTNNGAACTNDSGCDITIPGSCALTANCFFGPPLPIANGGLSTCVVNVIETDGSGTADLTTGVTNVSLPLFSRTHLTTNATSPCPKCVGSPALCNAGARAGLSCTPVGTLLTSLDCPPAPATLLSPFPVPLGLSTSGSQKTAADGNFCPGQSDAPTQVTGFSGAFGYGGQDPTHPLAECIQENGSPAGDLTDGNPHPAVLGSVFCIPKTNQAAIDGAADLPGPGGITLNVNAQATN